MADINNQPNIPQKARGDEVLGKPSQEKVKRGKGTPKEFVDQHEIKHEKDVPLSERPSIRARALVDNAKDGKTMPKEAMKLYAQAYDKNLDGYKRIYAAGTLATISGQENNAAEALFIIAQDTKVNIYDRKDAAEKIAKRSGQESKAAEAWLAIARDKSVASYDRTLAAEKIAKINGQEIKLADAWLAIAQDNSLHISNRKPAAEKLASITGQESKAAEAWLAIAQDNNIEGSHRIFAAEKLSIFTDQKNNTTDILLAVTQDKKLSASDKIRAAEILYKFSGKDKNATEILASVAQDKSVAGYIRIKAAEELTKSNGQKSILTDTLLSVAQDKSVDGNTRIQAAEKLATINGQKSKAADILLSIAQDKSVAGYIRIKAAEELAKSNGQESILTDTLLSVAQDKSVDGNTRIQAAEKLATINGQKSKAADILLSIAQDKSVAGYIRIKAAEKLAKLSGQESILTDTLLSVAQDKSVAVSTRIEAAEKLAKFSGQESVLTDTLLSVAQDKSVYSSTRIEAAEKLANINGQKSKAAEAWLAIAQDNNVEVSHRIEAAEKLANISRQDSKTAEAWLAIAQDNNIEGRLRIEAAEKLTKISGQENKAADILLSIAKYTNLTPYYRNSAAGKLATINGQESKAADAFLFIARDNSIDASYRISAAEKYAKFSGQENALTETLISAAQDKSVNVYTRIQAAEKLAKMNGQENKASEIFLAIAQDKNVYSNTRIEAAEKLAKMNGKNSKAAEAFLAIAQDINIKDPNIRIEAALKAGQIHSYEEQSVNILISIAKSAKEDIYPENKLAVLNHINDSYPHYKSEASDAFRLAEIKTEELNFSKKNKFLSIFKAYDLKNEAKKLAIQMLTSIDTYNKDESRLHALKAVIALSQNKAEVMNLIDSLMKNQNLSLSKRYECLEHLIRADKPTKTETFSISHQQVLDIYSEFASNPSFALKKRLQMLQFAMEGESTRNKAAHITLSLLQSTKRPHKSHLNIIKNTLEVFKATNDQEGLKNTEELLKRFETLMTGSSLQPIYNETTFTRGNDYSDHGFTSVSDKMGKNADSKEAENTPAAQAEAEKLKQYIKKEHPDNTSIAEPKEIKAHGHTLEINQGVPASEKVGPFKVASGVILMEPDGRIWVRKVASLNPNQPGFAGTVYSFPKGTYEAKDGLTLQQSAIKESYEETGFECDIEGVLTDQQRTGSVTRVYVGKRKGGSPADHGRKTAGMMLVDAQKALELFKNNSNDHDAKLVQQLVETKKIPFSVKDGGNIKSAHPPLPSAFHPWPKLEELKLLPVSLGGGTGARLYEAPDGTKYVAKQGANPTPAAHITSEFVANQMCEAAGENVPAAKLYTSGKLNGEEITTPTQLTVFLEGSVTLREYLEKAPPEKAAAMKSKIENRAALQMLLANHDVFGLNGGNVMIYNDEPYYIDTGCSLMFRALGPTKSPYTPLSQTHEKEHEGYNKHPSDMFTMAGKGMKMKTELSAGYTEPRDNWSSKMYSNLDIENLADQIIELNSKIKMILANVPDDIPGVEFSKSLKRVVGQRMYYMNELARDIKAMKAHGWSSEYVWKVAMFRIGLRLEGIKAQMPKNLVLTEQKEVNEMTAYEYEDPFNLKGKQDEPFGGLRAKPGTQELLQSFTKLYTGVNSDQFSFVNIIKQQAGDSFSPMSRAVKYMLFKNQPNKTFDHFYWKHSEQEEQQNLKSILATRQISEEQFLTTIQCMHAATQEVLRKTQFKNNDQSSKTVTLVRSLPVQKYTDHQGNPVTAKDDQGNLIQITPDHTGVYTGQSIYLKDAVFSSTSIFKPVDSKINIGAGGSHVAEYNVPHDQVIFTYFLAEMSDEENEFVVQLDETPAHSIYSQAAVPQEKQDYYQQINPPQFFQPKPKKDLGDNA